MVNLTSHQKTYHPGIIDDLIVEFATYKTITTVDAVLAVDSVRS